MFCKMEWVINAVGLKGLDITYADLVSWAPSTDKFIRD